MKALLAKKILKLITFRAGKIQKNSGNVPKFGMPSTRIKRIEGSFLRLSLFLAQLTSCIYFMPICMTLGQGYAYFPLFG